MLKSQRLSAGFFVLSLSDLDSKQVSSSVKEKHMAILISIVVPTYNRSALLCQLLKTIEASVAKANAFELVEVCISDNCSTDNTMKALAEFKQVSPLQLKFAAQSKNHGPDANYLACAEQATGRFIWFMGSDDGIVIDAVDLIIARITALETNAPPITFMILDRLECDRELVVQKERHWLQPFVQKRLFDLKQVSERARYLDVCTSIGGVFSYLSSIIVARQAWEMAPVDQQMNGSGYIHVAKLLRIFFDDTAGLLVSIPECLVMCRGDNDDTFGAEGRLARIYLDFNFYTSDLVLQLFDEQQRFIFQILRREWPIREIQRAFRSNSDRRYATKLRSQAALIYGRARSLATLSEFSILMYRLNSARKQRRKN